MRRSRPTRTTLSRWTPPTATRCSGCSATFGWASRATARTGATRWSRARNASARSPGRSRAAGPHTAEEAEQILERTSHFWRGWLAEGRYPDHPWRAHLQRSALVLKGLTFMPTGALVAAPTTSLPETPGGERNWDYRFCWMRDASFTLWALHALGLDWEADDFIEYVAEVPRNEDGSLQIMYGVQRRERPVGVDARPSQGLRGRTAGAHRQRRLRSAPERRVRCGAGLRLPALQAARPHSRAPVAGAGRPGQMRGGRVEGARPGHLGGARKASALRLLEADVLGRDGSRRAACRTTRQRRYGRGVPGHRRRSSRGPARQRSRLARRVSPALRHRCAGRLDAAGAVAALPAP